VRAAITGNDAEVLARDSDALAQYQDGLLPGRQEDWVLA
jgi:hypothetical protein